MNRRNALKVIALALAGAGSVAANEQLKTKEIFFVKKISPRTVQYGKARHDYPVGWIQLIVGQKHLWDGIYQFCTNDIIQVYCLEPIKKGQALIWHPDGTVTGGLHEKTDSKAV